MKFYQIVEFFISFENKTRLKCIRIKFVIYLLMSLNEFKKFDDKGDTHLKFTCMNWIVSQNHHIYSKRKHIFIENGKQNSRNIYREFNLIDLYSKMVQRGGKNKFQWIILAIK